MSRPICCNPAGIIVYYYADNALICTSGEFHGETQQPPCGGEGTDQKQSLLTTRTPPGHLLKHEGYQRDPSDSQQRLEDAEGRKDFRRLVRILLRAPRKTTWSAKAKRVTSRNVRRGILSIEFSGNSGVIKTRPGTPTASASRWTSLRS
jgi:hypothetical protein